MSESKRTKGKQVSATVDEGLYKALEDYGWENRRTRTDLVREAVEEHAKRLGIWPPAEEHHEHREHHGNDAA